MSALSSSLEGRSFQIFISQLIKYVFYDDKSVNIDTISTLFSSLDLSAASVEAEIFAFAQALRKFALESYKPSKLEKFINQTQLSETNMQSLLNVWSNEYEKIMHAVAKETVWNEHFHHLSWRVDVRTESKYQSQMNEPSVLFELGTTSGHVLSVKDARANNVNKVKFEMNREQLSGFLEQLETIQKKMNEINA